MGGDHYDEMSDNALLRPYVLHAKRMYTGLKDKEGREIYEGDIVHYKCKSGSLSWDMNGEIKWDGCVWKYWNFILGQNMPGVYPEDENQRYLEVIGNIYENPELLEK